MAFNNASMALEQALNSIVERFEQAWQAGRPPAIEDFLGDTSVERGQLLVELVHTDLEYRLKIGQKVGVEDYIRRYPEIEAHGAQLVELIVAEYSLCRFLGCAPDVANFLQRFPAVRPQLAVRLGSGGESTEIKPNRSRRDPASAPSFSDEPDSTVIQSGPAGAKAAGQPPLGPVVGRFTVLSSHAEGGMSEVFRANDVELHREVALKRLKADYATDEESRGRFLREAEITAQLDHPGIVPIYGMVRDDAGLPWYAMRFIGGENLRDAIRKYHKEQRGDEVSLRKLLQRFVSICQTVAYAHSKGVIHRDLKPANVMLGAYGETLVIDWGLARKIGHPRNDGGHDTTSGTPQESPLSGLTRPGTVMGTWAYMSPEQARGQADNLGPATDIYSLGVVLYELLTGQARWQGQGIEEFKAKLLRGEFPSPRQMNKAVPRPLEAICLKAMAVSPQDRYATALELATEVERYLADEPVCARRDPWLERSRRWLRKHRTLARSSVAAVLAALICLSGATLLLSAAYEREAFARSNAEKATETAKAAEASETRERGKAESAATTALAAEADARAVLGFFKDKVLAAARPEGQEGGLGIDATIRAAADAAEPRIAEDFRDSPVVEASVRDVLGLTYWYLGEANLAIVQHERALKLRKANLGPEHPDTLQSMNNLASAYQDASRLNDALALSEQTLKLRKANLGPEHPDTLQSMNNLASAYQDAGRLNDAVALYEKTLTLRKAKLGLEHRNTLRTMNNLAETYRLASRPNDALPLFEKTLQLRKANLGPEHPDTLQSMNSLAAAYQDVGRLNDALPLYEETLKLSKARLGLKHPDTLISMNNLASAYQAAGRLNDALPLFEESLKLHKAKLGPEHSDTLNSLNNLAAAYSYAGRFNDALPLFEETLKQFKAKFGPEHPNTLTSMNNLASAYQAAGRLNDALPLFEETLKLSKAKLGLEHSRTLKVMGNLAKAYQAAGRFNDALPLFEEGLKLFKTNFGPEHPDTLISMNDLALAYQAAGKLDLALPLLEETLKLTKAKLGPEHPNTLTSMNNLASAYWSAKQLDNSIPLFEEALKRLEAKLGRDHPDTLGTVAQLGVNYKDAGRLAEAIPLLEEVYRAAQKYPMLRGFGMPLLDAYAKAGENAKFANLLQEQLAETRKALPKDSPQLAGNLAQIGLGLLEQKKWTEAEPLIRESLAIREKTQPDVWSTFNSKSMLGGVLLSQKKYADAEPFLLQGFEGMKQREKQIPPQGRIRLIEALERIVQLYEATEQQDQAENWRKQLDAAKAKEMQSKK